MKGALKILKKFKENKFEAIIVGGFVRDKVLGIDSSDIDIVTNANLIEIRNLFPNCEPGIGTNFHVNIVDGYEVASYRKDVYSIYWDVTVNVAKTFKDDSSRRDLTINAMGFNPFTDEIIDYWNGQNDLSNRLIRFVDVAALRIQEDPLRMLRACRFAAKIKGRLVPSAFFAIKDHAELIDTVPVERIKDEIIKALKTEKPSIFFEYLHRTGLLNRIMPELDDCWYHDGGKYHSEYINEHLMDCGDFLSHENPIMRLAGYLHDIGKVEAYDEYDFSFKRHEKMGADIARDMLTRLKFPTKDIEKICGMILLHMRPLYNITSSKSVRKLSIKLNKFKISHDEFIKQLEADRYANRRKIDLTKEEVKELYDVFENAFEKQEPVFSVKDLAINGNDVMNTGIPKGPNVGRVLNYYFELVLEDPELNDRSFLLDCLNRVDKWSELK